MIDTQYDGRQPYQPPGGAPKPSRFNELVAAHVAGDWNLVAEIEQEYHATEARDR